MQDPEELTFKDLREITDGFSKKVGEGGFGTVYKGVAKTGKHVAVKILRDVISDLNYEQFRNEFRNLTKVQHDNIVQFLGYCCEREQTRIECNGRIVLAENMHRALCFEFMHNGSLQKHLSDESSGLDWNTRYKIIKGTCEGLRYIHGESLLHLDMKSDNILLDKNMVPKIADFGLSRIFGDQLTSATQCSFGTLGYKPPEYIDKKEISNKFDIYSLGVIIIKIVSGPESYPECLRMPSHKLVDQVRKNWRERWQATCSSDFSLEACCRQVEKCTQMALDCLQNDSKKRPDIVKMIEELNKIEPDINKVIDIIANFYIQNMFLTVHY
ncbi:hypothetical protein HU200_008445 [Digitaria exilis]|uniref:Protein kinase domain-containing protein n=1 Tax=Digitaria exilis TaxID=1010633 RepID=A0A835KTL5_9POAL|nr:hypothetical protein HU200_008445 [Digitaria exilis]